MKQENCSLCEKYEQEGSVLYETANFYVAPSLGPLVEGHLLLISKEHVEGIAHLDTSLLGEFEETKKRIRTVLNRVYDSPIFFEHGPLNKFKRGGCCIDHVHLHCLPLKVDISQDLNKHFQYSILNTFHDLKEAVLRLQQDYIYYENQEEKRQVFYPYGALPSQYLRKIIACRLDKPLEWDWRINPNIRDFNRTLVRLAGVFSFRP